MMAAAKSIFIEKGYLLIILPLDEPKVTQCKTNGQPE